MKKILTTISALALFQFAVAQQHAIGFRGGLNLATVSMSATSGSTYGSGTLDRKAGINIGITSEIRAAKGFSICPELYYSQQGYSVGSSSSLSFGYLNIPVLLRGSFGSEYARFFINGGPQLGIFTNGSGTENGTSGDLKPNYIEAMDLSLVLGMGVGIKAGNGEFIFDLRYNVGMTNILGSAGVSYLSTGGYSDVSIRNNVMSLSLGYLFYLSKP